MTSAFSSNDAAAIERNIDTDTDRQSIQEIWNEARCSECSAWITKNNFKKVKRCDIRDSIIVTRTFFQVCLQFPDNLIRFSIEITIELSQLVECEVFVLGDTSYGSCCIDEVSNSCFRFQGIDADNKFKF